MSHLSLGGEVGPKGRVRGAFYGLGVCGKAPSPQPSPPEGEGALKPLRR